MSLYAQIWCHDRIFENVNDRAICRGEGETYKLLKRHLRFLLLVNTCSSTSKLVAFLDVTHATFQSYFFTTFHPYILTAECRNEHFILVLVPKFLAKMREVIQEKGSLQPVHLGLLLLPLVVQCPMSI